MPIEENKLIDLLRGFNEEIIQSVDHRIGISQEDFPHRLDLVVEGQQALSEKIDRVESNLKEELRKVDQRVTGVGVDLSAHRRDTEAHRKSWRVREEKGVGSIERNFNLSRCPLRDSPAPQVRAGWWRGLI